ncbi:MAG: type II toxin-antitoxin system RelE/ParE family toxin [Lactobacillus sp.]|nr:type II toxin-antitoxin system RelE/ParE family toxin [Lactobacillus sp.]
MKEQFLDHIFEDIANDPYSGGAKKGDLKDFYAYKFKYECTDYRIAYTIHDSEVIVVIVLVGKRENFYSMLKRLL